MYLHYDRERRRRCIVALEARARRVPGLAVLWGDDFVMGGGYGGSSETRFFGRVTGTAVFGDDNGVTKIAQLGRGTRRL